MHYLPRVSDALCMSRRRTEAQPTSMSAGVECPVMHAVVMRTCLPLHRRSEVHIYVTPTSRERGRERDLSLHRRCTALATLASHTSAFGIWNNVSYQYMQKVKKLPVSPCLCCSYLSVFVTFSFSVSRTQSCLSSLRLFPTSLPVCMYIVFKFLYVCVCL